MSERERLEDYRLQAEQFKEWQGFLNKKQTSRLVRLIRKVRDGWKSADRE